MMTQSLTSTKIDRIARLAIAAAAACGMVLATPAMARDGSSRDIVINIGKDGDLLKQLIDLDQDGIEELRADIADARADIADAINDIDDAREEVKGVPGAGIVLKIAFASARAGVSTAIDEALGDARVEIDKAERGLAVADVSAEERAETQEAIGVLRGELDALEVSLNELIDALRA
jgi:hypothetical protein